MFVTKYVVLLNLIEVIHCTGTLKILVAGGKRALILDFPHSAYLHASCSNFDIIGPWNCAGSIINQDIMLTAAHCIDGCPGDMNMIITAGNVKRFVGHRSTAKSYVRHEKFIKSSGQNDIGLVKMATRVQFSPTVNRVAIMRNPPKREVGYVAAWGLTDEDKAIQTDYLMSIKQVLWEREDCIKYYKKLKQNEFCASSNEADKYLTTGDSGAALVINGYIQIGIVGYKSPRISNNLVVFTNVSSHYEWILNNAEKLYCGS